MWRVIMMEFDSRELTCLIFIVLLLSCRRLSVCFFMWYLMRRRFQRWRLLAMIQQSTAVLTRQIRRRETRAHARRSVWSLPRPQLWFERLLNDRSRDGWWKENFWVSRATFEYICRLVGPALSRQNTAMRAAVPVEKRVSTSLWRLATGDCYRTCGLMMGVSKYTTDEDYFNRKHFYSYDGDAGCCWLPWALFISFNRISRQLTWCASLEIKWNIWRCWKRKHFNEAYSGS